MQTICKVVHGSYLYRLNGEGSDRDYKSIHLPDIKDCVLDRMTRNQQEKGDDVEHESFSLQRWLSLAANGESLIIDMLHCADEDVLIDSPLWQTLRANRRRFYTKKMSGSLGYAISQSNRYSTRSDRLTATEQALRSIKVAHLNGVSRLWQWWDNLPEAAYLVKSVDERNNGKDNRVYQVASKSLQATITIEYAIEILERLVASFGERVRAASEMKGKDFKALSHAYRVAYQLLGLYERGDFSYPLPETPFLLDLKYGRVDWACDKLDEKLSNLVDKVTQLADNSSYPAKVDRGWLDSLILSQYNIS